MLIKLIAVCYIFNCCFLSAQKTSCITILNSGHDISAVILAGMVLIFTGIVLITKINTKNFPSKPPPPPSKFLPIFP